MKRKRFSSDFKARVAVEAIRGEKTISEIASKYEVHPNVVGQWKKRALESLPDIFSGKQKTKSAEESELRDRLYQQIGQLQVELDWLKKKTGFIE